MAKKYTIAETYELPSLGKIYDKEVNPIVKLRSMTAEDEMKRLSPSELAYKTLCDVIDDCLVEDIGISSYDLCLGDYEYLLHKLRVVTYGADYKMVVPCPVCRGTTEVICNLDELQSNVYDEDFEALRTVTLPVSGKIIELKFQTPRILDEIAKRKKDIIKKNPGMLTDPGYLLTICSYIKTIDGIVYREDQIESFVRKLPMKDANFLLNKATELNERIGIDTNFACTCKHCGYEMMSTFRFGPEFFRPTTD